MITVYECGNGDCILIEDANFNLQIDLGKHINLNLKAASKGFKYDLMITHSHTDHVVGNLNSLKSLPQKIFVPAYFPEYLCIKNMLMGNKNSVLKGSKYELVYEGMKLYNKHEVLNPSLTPWKNWKIAHSKKIDVKLLDEFLATKNTSYKQIMDEIKSLKDCYEKPSDTKFDPIKFVESYFKLLIKVKDIAEEGDDTTSATTTTSTQSPAQRLGFFMTYFDKYQANDMSIVFRYEDAQKKNFLFTGDAGLATRRRLIAAGKKISCDVLKVPHHGSKESLNLEILNNMKPKIAIISHKNEHGKIDKHPNVEILGYLKFFSVENHFTNNVVKRTVTWNQKTVGKINGYDITFI